MDTLRHLQVWVASFWSFGAESASASRCGRGRGNRHGVFPGKNVFCSEEPKNSNQKDNLFFFQIAIEVWKTEETLWWLCLPCPSVPQLLNHLIYHSLGMCSTTISSFGARIVAENQQSLLHGAQSHVINAWMFSLMLHHSNSLTASPDHGSISLTLCVPPHACPATWTWKFR